MTPYYEDDWVTLYHGDCREALGGITADVLITDPPYGMNLGKHGGANDQRSRELRRGGYGIYEDTPENYVGIVAPAIVWALQIVKRGAVFAPAPSAWALPPPTSLGGVFIPAANGRSPWGFQNLAPVLFYGTAPLLNLGAKATMIRASGRAPVELGHPCPKPLEWMRWLVVLAAQGTDIVLDPFAGSGTTLRAAKDCGYRSIGIEIEERYCEIAARRLSQEVFSYSYPSEPETG